ncbi:acyl-(acyl-carrier-protein)--UDP-N-acetylglucosamine O-acyltransferase [Spongiibacter sp. IMCC21906]|nr:acyl-ACP--UDP-N-acetylglucosamine O-acyltransferase [Spongiibacter sp. IMCC21906]AKH70276.1 acyl-(acyl-carrier-protein)--UDP-N-acetylglucosamine O-acyltransferase [Spongiibacter sp. IMCC21906]
MAGSIHPSAEIDPRSIIDPEAIIGANCKIGPWTIVGPQVELGEGCDIRSHVVLKGPSRIGTNNTIYQFSSVGEDTPDLKYNGEPTELIVGDNNIIRECVTIHRGTIQDQGKTIVGSHNLIMAYVHIGHDSIVGDHCILVNNTALAGHVVVGDWAILSGYTLVHQFCQVGAHSFTGYGSGISKDVPAYVTVSGSPAEAKTINAEGLRRRGFSSEAITAIRKAYKIIYRQGLTVAEAVEKLKPLVDEFSEVDLLLKSLTESTRGITR